MTRFVHVTTAQGSDATIDLDGVAAFVPAKNNPDEITYVWWKEKNANPLRLIGRMQDIVSSIENQLAERSEK